MGEKNLIQSIYTEEIDCYREPADFMVMDSTLKLKYIGRVNQIKNIEVDGIVYLYAPKPFKIVYGEEN